MESSPQVLRVVRLAGLAVLGVVLIFGTYFGWHSYKAKELALETVSIELASTTTAYTKALETNALLSRALSHEKGQNSVFENQISQIGSTVGTLQKLATTDTQLLAKYSKIYFLNENYIPSSLSSIATSSVFEKNKVVQAHSSVEPFLERMFLDAKNDGINLQVISGYRSFATQQSLKANYKVTYGAGTANAFSADQGYSEHQLGTAFDLTTSELGTGYTVFAKTEGYTWLQANAYKYGFILSYPKTNTFYQFEPWHWRFVGVRLAGALHADKEDFYTKDQREINSYLAELFDN